MGRLEAGALSNIAVVYMQTINKIPCRDSVKNLLNTAFRIDVVNVIVKEELVVEEGVFLTVEEERFMEEAQRTTEAQWRRIPENHYRGFPAKRSRPRASVPGTPEGMP